MDREKSELFDSHDTEKELQHVVTVSTSLIVAYLISTMRENNILDHLKRCEPTSYPLQKH